MRINVLALEGAFDTGLAAVMDVFSTANELADLQGTPSLRFQLALVGVRRKVCTSLGLRVPVTSSEEAPDPDLVVVPAIGYKMPETLQRALLRADVRQAGDALHRWRSNGARVAAACIGTFVLAESGLLAGHQATTTWWLAPLFRQRYPDVDLQDSRMLVRSGPYLTAGAALGHMDMALALLRDVSPSLADSTARYLVVDSRAAQSAYALVDHLAHSDPLVRRFEEWARARLAQGFSVEMAASELGTSRRTLARRVGQALGRSPLAFFQELRVQHAVHLLRTTRHSLDRIAEMVGYADGVTLGNLLRRRLGRSARELRAG